MNENPPHYIASNTTIPRCQTHGNTMQMCMGRVEAGVGGPRPYYQCDRCEADRQEALAKKMAVCAHGTMLWSECIHCETDQRQTLEVERPSESKGLEVACIGCDRQLSEPGGILLSPPMHHAARSSVSKAHLCVECYDRVEAFLAGRFSAAL